MALVFPLPLADFADRLRPLEHTFDLAQPAMTAGDGGGEIFEAANAPAYWNGTMTTALPRGAEGRRMRSLFDVLRQPGKPFLMRLKSSFGPQNDPNGAILAGRNLALAAVEPHRIKIGPASGSPTIKGYPPELRLLPDDMIEILYGSNPLRYGLHKVAPAAAHYGFDPSAPGRSKWVDIVPPLRNGVAVGAAVTLYKPACKALLLKDSVSGGSSRFGGGLWTPITFSWRQTLR